MEDTVLPQRAVLEFALKFQFRNLHLSYNIVYVSNSLSLVRKKLLVTGWYIYCKKNKNSWVQINKAGQNLSHSIKISLLEHTKSKEVLNAESSI